MRFKAYIPLSDIDIQVANANGTEIEWYASKLEIYAEYGTDCPITSIIISDLVIELDNYDMEFNTIGEN
tara:strand:- start:588 stop:794 length:207 start_codon:yes stop_codon:yes gene_type:complete